MRWCGILKGCDIGHTDGDEFLGRSVERADRSERIGFRVRAGFLRFLIRAGSIRFLIRAGSLRYAVVLVCLALLGDRDPGSPGCYGV
jgi:hypothetical protein